MASARPLLAVAISPHEARIGGCQVREISLLRIVAGLDRFLHRRAGGTRLDREADPHFYLLRHDLPMPLEAVARVVAETRLPALTAPLQAHAPEFQFVVLVTGEHFR